MAITTYTELQAAVGNWLHRSDLTPRIPEFIELAEAQMSRRLRVRPMIARYQAIISDEFSAVPADFLGVRSLHLNTNPITRLQFVDPDTILTWKAENAPTGKPVRFSIVGAEFQYSPAPDSSYTAELSYYQAIPPLSANATNWLLDSHPDAYLYGALTQAAPYLKDDARLPMWGELFRAAVADIEAEDAGVSYQASAPRFRTF